MKEEESVSFQSSSERQGGVSKPEVNFDFFENLFSNEKSHKFAVHLIFSFFQNPEMKMIEESGKRCYCSICTDLVYDEKNSIVNLLDSGVDETVFNKKIAFRAPQSDLVVCLDCIQTFYHWVGSKLVQKDKLVCNIIRDRMIKRYSTRTPDRWPYKE